MVSFLLPGSGSLISMGRLDPLGQRGKPQAKPWRKPKSLLVSVPRTACVASMQPVAKGRNQTQMWRHSFLMLLFPRWKCFLSSNFLGERTPSGHALEIVFEKSFEVTEYHWDYTLTTIVATQAGQEEEMMQAIPGALETQTLASHREAELSVCPWPWIYYATLLMAKRRDWAGFLLLHHIGSDDIINGTVCPKHLLLFLPGHIHNHPK